MRVLTSKATKEITYKSHLSGSGTTILRSKFSFDLTDFLIRYHSGRREERAREREGGELEESAPDQFSEVSLAVFFSVFFRPHTFLFRYHCAARRVKG